MENDTIELNILDSEPDLAALKKKKKKSGHRFQNFKAIFDGLNNWMIEQSTIPLDDKLYFFQLLATMITSGMPIHKTMDMLEEQSSNAKLKLVIRDIKDSLGQGLSLAEAFAKNGDVFDKATSSVVAAGEKSGQLEYILKELVIQYEQRHKLTKQVKSVMTYPIIVITAMILLGAIVLIFVIPDLVKMFDGAENLPMPTQIMMMMSDFLVAFWWLLIIGVSLFVFLFGKWKNTISGQKIWNSFLFAMPLIGGILQKMILTRFSRIFGFLVQAGVPIVEALRISASVTENPLYENRINLAADDLTRGIPIAENLAGNEKLFPKMLVSMIAIGEKSAALDVILNKAADFFSEDVERKVGSLSKILEPLILAVIAAGAVFMLLAVYLPILQMNDHVG